jgi:type I restriction enzyme M protein
MVRTSKSETKKNNGATLGFEARLFQAADKMRGTMDAGEYKHVALGLIFLKYISDAFEAKHAALIKAGDDAEDRDYYLAENIFWVPKDARWNHLQANAKQPTIGKLIDDAMIALEGANLSLKGVLPKDYARPALNKQMLGELIDLISSIGLHEENGNSKDILGRVYEYFLGGFAGAEGKRGGEFYTPRSVVMLLVEMLEPYKGRIFDPCCGSGGMFVQSEKFVLAHGGRLGDIAIYGQESNNTTWRLAKMNMAVRGIDADIRWNNEGSFHKNEFRDLKADYILANPPFNISDWGGERLRDDARWKFGTPLWATPTTAGCSIFFITSAPLARRAWCWPMAVCRPPPVARAISAAPWLKPTWWIAWSPCQGSCFIRPRFPPVCGFSPAPKTQMACETGAARFCSLMPVKWAYWWNVPAAS